MALASNASGSQTFPFTKLLHSSTSGLLKQHMHSASLYIAIAQQSSLSHFEPSQQLKKRLLILAVTKQTNKQKGIWVWICKIGERAYSKKFYVSHVSMNATDICKIKNRSYEHNSPVVTKKLTTSPEEKNSPWCCGGGKVWHECFTQRRPHQLKWFSVHSLSVLKNN